MAESLEAQDRRQAAETEYEAALAPRPDLLEALLGLAKLKRIRLACDEAIALYKNRAEASVRPTFEGAYGLGMCESVRQNDGCGCPPVRTGDRARSARRGSLGRARHILEPPASIR